MILCQFYTYAQLQENFSDGDFTHDPTWTGDTDYFTVNAAGQLQTNGPAVTGTELQLATPCQAVTGTTWEFFARLNLATSSGNYADIFLISDSANFKGRNNGYFVRIGGTPDEVSLFRKDAGGNPVYIINGRDGTIGATTNNVVKVKVTRDSESRWTLWVDVSGTGQNYQEEGQAIDATYQQSGYFGVLVKYSSANNQRFFFDDFIITDNAPPLLRQVQVINNLAINILFNEPVALPTAQNPENYLLQNIGQPLVAVRDATNPALVHLTFAQAFPAGTHTLIVSGLTDLYGNKLVAPQTTTFSYNPPVAINYREVRINEVLADVNPTVGLPAAEFIELYNNSSKTINLQGWQYADATTARGTLPAYILTPNSYVILCRVTDTTAFRPFGNVLGLSVFPTLNDSGDEVRLFNNTGQLIDKIIYTTAWYQDARKAEGGWSLELINPLLNCSEATNWIAATDPSGGTPGKQNSVYSNTPDTQPPTLLKTEVMAGNQLKLTFSENLDSLTARNIAAYTVSPAINITAVTFTGKTYQQVLLTLANNLQPRQVYEITVRQVRDCAGNLSSEAKATVVLPEPAAIGDVVINEILFNPRSGGVDFVEIVNRSIKYIDLKNWQLGNLQPDSASDKKIITEESLVMAPGEYLLLTTRPDVVQAHYPAAKPEAFIKMDRLPSFPDEQGTVLLIEANQKLMDRFAYHEDMHFKLLADVNGVSLERIRLQGDSSATNWHSAASSVNYATPGYKNSQYFEQTPSTQFFNIEPKIFTPDEDGENDFTTINYRTEAAGFVTNITVYDASGREIKRLVKNELLAQNGFFRWDGLDDRGRKVPVGYYVLFIELFNLQGQVKAYKETVVVGTRF
ncbi:lamin tail domain-containing protein [Adhaeribacter rhizoryzae]|uniref:lamin tail domain-containing protein n=1 Tax=Adhaeribacter rhizoryzae TaxID=2607907 RepID=UPI00167FDEF9|nr:lamin tail domain-containing protein [Adhaeribacter rhizoryzae]